MEVGFIRALDFAAQKHGNQRRKGVNALPYIVHPIAVVRVLVEAGVIDNNVLCAAVLHDVVEDCGVKYKELVELFGGQVADIVMEVSDNRALNQAKRKEAQIAHAPFLSYEAKLVKFADKICNVRDVLNDPPPNWDLQRRSEYIEFAEQVCAGIGFVNSYLEQYFNDLIY